MAARHDSNPNALAKHARKSKKRRGTGLTKRVEGAIAALIDGERDTLSGAAESVGLTPRAFRMALRKPNVLAHYKEELEALRNGERARNLRTLVEIRDDAELKTTAAGQKVRIEAVKALEPQPEGHPSFNIRAAGDVRITPGYCIDLTEPGNKPQADSVMRPPLPHDRSDSAKIIDGEAREVSE